MRFDVECVRKCLAKNGVVFTVRGYMYQSEWSKLDNNWIRRLLIKEVNSKGDLEAYVALSGFESIEEWWNKIEEFCRNKRKFLYFVLVPVR